MDNFACPRCGAVSYNPNDIEHGYCGRCHAFTGDQRFRVVVTYYDKSGPTRRVLSGTRAEIQTSFEYLIEKLGAEQIQVLSTKEVGR